jgi:hypothetical protein
VPEGNLVGLVIDPKWHCEHLFAKVWQLEQVSELSPWNWELFLSIQGCPMG